MCQPRLTTPNGCARCVGNTQPRGKPDRAATAGTVGVWDRRRRLDRCRHT
ncbi:hypothetical protein [Richelia intracellularis]|nr:hypothetical protein [Richelia intracellularis]